MKNLPGFLVTLFCPNRGDGKITNLSITSEFTLVIAKLIIVYRTSSNSSCVTKQVLPFENEIIHQRGRGEGGLGGEGRGDSGSSTTDNAL